MRQNHQVNTGQSVGQRAVRGTAFVLASSYTNMALGMVYGIIMARLLDPDHFGIVALATFFFTLLDLRGKLGLDQAFIHRPSTTDDLISTHWTLQTAASAVTLAFVAIVSLVVTRFDYPAAIAPVMIVLSGVMLVEAVGTTARAALEKELIFARSTLVITSALFVSYVAAILMALGGWTYWALVGQVAANAVLGTIGFWWSFRHVNTGSIRFCFNREIARWMLSYGLVMSVGAIATAILLQFDNFLVGTFVSAAALGYYALAYKVAQWPTGLVTHIISRAALPTYAKLQDDPLRLGKAFQMSLWVILTIATPLALAIFVSAPDFLRLLYGDKWLPSATLLRFLIGYSVLRPLLDDTGALFTAIGKPRQITTVLVIQAVTLVLVATPLTFVWNATGTAIGVGVAFVVGILITYRFVGQAITLDVKRMFVPPVMAAIGSIALYMLLATQFDLNVLPLFIRVLFKGGFAATLFFGILLVLERGIMVDRVGYVWRLLRSTSI